MNFVFMMSSSDSGGGWTFLTNHAHVLVCIARQPEMRLREIGVEVGITERAVHKIVTDLVEAGYVARTRVGNHNHYEIRPDLPLRHPLERDHAVGEVLATFIPTRKR